MQTNSVNSCDCASVGAGLCVVLITRPEGSYRVWCVCDREASIKGGPVSSKWWLLAHIIKKDRFKMAEVVGLSTSRREYFVRKDCIRLKRIDVGMEFV